MTMARALYIPQLILEEARRLKEHSDSISESKRVFLKDKIAARLATRDESFLDRKIFKRYFVNNISQFIRDDDSKYVLELFLRELEAPTSSDFFSIIHNLLIMRQSIAREEAAKIARKLAVSNCYPELHTFWRTNLSVLVNTLVTGENRSPNLNVDGFNLSPQRAHDFIKEIGIQQSHAVYRPIQRMALFNARLGDFDNTGDWSKLKDDLLSLNPGRNGYHHTINNIISDLRKTGLRTKFQLWRDNIFQPLIQNPWDNPQAWTVSNGISETNMEWYRTEYLLDNIEHYFSDEMNLHRRKFWLHYAKRHRMIDLPHNLPNAHAVMFYLKGNKDLIAIEFYVAGEGSCYLYLKEKLEKILATESYWDKRPPRYYKATDPTHLLFDALIDYKPHTAGPSSGRYWDVRWQESFEQWLRELGVSP